MVYLSGALFLSSQCFDVSRVWCFAFKEAKGGIYSWLAGSVGEKIAFIGTFIWLASWVIWLVSTSNKVWIPLSALLFGKDTTQSWNFLGLGATQTIGLLAIIWILGVTFFSTRGMDFVAKVGSIGGIFTIVLNVIFCVASVVIWIADHGALKQPITSWSSFYDFT